MLKSTYGTGCFALLNTGADLVASKHRLLTHDRLPARRQADLCARGRDLRRGSRDPMAARRPRRAAVGRGERPDGGRGRPRAGGDPGAGLRRARRAALGRRRARRHLRADARDRAEGTGPGRAGKRLLPDGRPARRDAPGLGRRRRHGAARRRRHGGLRLDDAAPRRPDRRAGRPPLGARDDGARRRLSRRTAGRPSPFAGGPSRNDGRWSAASRRRCRRPSAAENSLPGGTRSGGCCLRTRAWVEGRGRLD